MHREILDRGDTSVHVLKSHDGCLSQRRVEHLDPLLPTRLDVVEGAERLALIIVQDGVAVVEGTALDVLPRQPHVVVPTVRLHGGRVA